MSRYVSPTFGWYTTPDQSKIGATIPTLLLAGLLLLAVACDDGPPPALTSQQRELIDTLYLRKIQPLRLRLDSLCNADFSINVQKSVDSLLQVRREEEIRLRERALNQAPSRTQDSLNPQ